MQIDCDRAPLIPGERRKLRVYGDGPFLIYSKCFVDTPRPAGFRECAECSPQNVVVGEPVVIDTSKGFWKGKTGKLNMIITDANSNSESIELVISSDGDHVYAVEYDESTM